MNNYAGKQLFNILSRGWWSLLLRGLIAILFGFFAWLMPQMSLRILVLLFGAFVLFDGILGAFMAIAGYKEHEDWWVLLLWGLVGIGIGILTVAVPHVTLVALVFFIAIWAVATGVLEIVVAIRLQREIEGERLVLLGGLMSVVFGILLAAHPEAGALALLWLIAAFAILSGILLVVLAIELHRLIRTFE